jgi:hypothetical protein
VKPKARERTSPTGALQLLMRGGLSAHDAADRLNTGLRTDKCHLCCNGNPLPVRYIVTSLVVIAQTDTDGHWRADIVSSTREAWVKSPDAYVFELEADELRALLPRQELRQDSDRQADGEHRKRSRTHEEIRQFGAGKWPEGWKHVETKDFIDAARKDEEFKRRVNPFPKRDQFLRALGRRKD